MLVSYMKSWKLMLMSQYSLLCLVLLVSQGHSWAQRLTREYSKSSRWNLGVASGPYTKNTPLIKGSKD